MKRLISASSLGVFYFFSINIYCAIDYFPQEDTYTENYAGTIMVASKKNDEFTAFIEINPLDHEKIVLKDAQKIYNYLKQQYNNQNKKNR